MGRIAGVVAGTVLSQPLPDSTSEALGLPPATHFAPLLSAAMVISSAGALALPGGVLGVAVGIAVHRVLVTLLQVGTGNDTPPQPLDVFTAPQLVFVVAAGMLVAILTAAVPARWAAGTPVVQVLRSE